MQGVTYLMCGVILGAHSFTISEEREDPFQDITLSYQEDGNDEVNVVDYDEDGDDDVDVE